MINLKDFNISRGVSLLAASVVLAGALPNTVDAAVFAGGPTVGFANFTPSSTLPAESGFPLQQIGDGITGANVLNGFVSNTLGTVSFLFGTNQNVRSFILWNDVIVQNEGIDNFQLRFFDSSDDQIAIPFSANYVGPVGQAAPEEYVFASPVLDVRRIELEVTSVQYTVIPTRIEIREVDFGLAIPEPSSAILLGLGGLAFAARRRRA